MADESKSLKLLRALRRDQRRSGEDEPMGYMTVTGEVLAWTGDDDAPYVKVLPTSDVPITVEVDQPIEVEGNVTHDSPETDPSMPVLIGGVATELAPDPVSAELDRVRAWFDLSGRQQVNHPQMLAGENIIHNYLGIIPKPVAVAQDSCDLSYEPGAASSIVAKASAGRLYACYVFNPTGGSLTFQIHNLAAAPGGGAVPVMTPITLPTITALFLDFSMHSGLFLDVGITMASSSAYATFTSSAGLHMTGFYK